MGAVAFHVLSDSLLHNDASRAGELACGVERFGPRGRYCLYAVFTRFDAIEWMVEDGALIDAVTGLPSVIRQGATRRSVLESLARPFSVRGCDRGLYASHLGHAMFVRQVYVLAGQREACRALYEHNKGAYRRELVDARRWRIGMGV